MDIICTVIITGVSVKPGGLCDNHFFFVCYVMVYLTAIG